MSQSAPNDETSKLMLPKGDACFTCRRRKVRCDGLKPTCSRCHRLRKECVYATRIMRSRPTEILEALALELELKVHRATLASAHDLSLASARLLERVGRLGKSTEQSPVKIPWLPTRPSSDPKTPKSATSRPHGQILGDGLGYTPVVPKDLIEVEINSYKWSGFDELPNSLSHHLISLFLPFRSQHFFFTDVSYFLRCLSYPSSHPEAIHPCLLNACYLSACAVSRGFLSSLQPFFLKRTRHFLERSLMFVDRIPHFLWANILLAANLGRLRRLEEAWVVISSASRFALACDLVRGIGAETESNKQSSEYLLPPPRNTAGAIDRIRLAHSIYITDQSIATFSGLPPTFHFDERWGSPSRPTYPPRDEEYKTQLAEIWGSDMHLKVLISRMFARVHKFALSYGKHGYHNMKEEYYVLDAQITAQHAAIPPLSDPRGLQPSEAVSAINPHLLLAHTTLYGSGLVLWSLRAGEDREARRKMLGCQQALVRICEMMRGPGPRSRVQGGLLSMLHVRNAVRVLAHELQLAEVRGNIPLSTNHCAAIEYLLDFLDDMTLSFPAYVDVPVSLKDTLTTTAQSLSNLE
ncbi:hypothetical protein DL93DRAFT_216705 [Clavulina sp. PMI_390]|nr:hypothetical protein DL93DRAFT_216705 [Clavulina sp. PMI_390]